MNLLNSKENIALDLWDHKDGLRLKKFVTDAITKTRNLPTTAQKASVKNIIKNMTLSPLINSRANCPLDVSPATKEIQSVPSLKLSQSKELIDIAIVPCSPRENKLLFKQSKAMSNQRKQSPISSPAIVKHTDHNECVFVIPPNGASSEFSIDQYFSRHALQALRSIAEAKDKCISRVERRVHRIARRMEKLRRTRLECINRLILARRRDPLPMLPPSLPESFFITPPIDPRLASFQMLSKSAFHDAIETGMKTKSKL